MGIEPTSGASIEKPSVPLFCDCCGDIVKVVYPCKFAFHDGREVPFNICLDCLDNGNLSFNLKRKHMVAYTLEALELARQIREE